MEKLSLDFETASDVDIGKHGAYRYAMDPSTEVLMFSWAFGNDRVSIWLPGMPFPKKIIKHIKAGGIICAWNATFERLIFKHVLCKRQLPTVPEPKLEQYQCTSARARAHGLPARLADAGRIMALPMQKMPDGLRLINTYCCMYGPSYIPFDQATPEDRQLFIDYCLVDTETERMVGNHLRELEPEEWAEYHLNERISDLGIPVDIALAKVAVGYAEQIATEVNQKIFDLTGGAVTKATQRKSRDKWVLEQFAEAKQSKLVELITKVRTDKKTKEETRKISFDKEHRAQLAKARNLPPKVAEFLERLEEAGGATLGKYQSMIDKSIDGRVSGALIWNGAGQTGRFSSMGLQVHNFRRDSLDEPEHTISDLLADYPVDNPSVTLARLVRSAIRSEKGLSWCDFSSIEGRVAPWLANTHGGEVKVQLYIDGKDPYIINAKNYYGRNYVVGDTDQRQFGKVQELSLQFLGGVGAVQRMGRNYGRIISEEVAGELRDSWRAANPWAQRLGWAMEAAAMKAVSKPGVWTSAGRLDFIHQGDWLWMQLPSGRMVAYYGPVLEPCDTPWGEVQAGLTCFIGSQKPKVGEPWPRRRMYSGLWVQNATQAVAADLLREALTRIDAAKEYPIIMHVHDEIVVESPSEDWFSLMEKQPEWAKGLPLKGAGGSGERYGK